MSTPEPSRLRPCVDCGIDLGKPTGKGRYSPRCDPCRKVHKKSYLRSWHETNYTWIRDYGLRRVHGISLQKYEALVEVHNGRCAICGKTAEEEGKALAVDHDHRTGTIRGLLCHYCNKGIGLLGDNAERVYKAARYIEERTPTHRGAEGLSVDRG